jgi:hypothetical protein
MELRMKMKRLVVNPLGEVLEVLGKRRYRYGPSCVNIAELKERIGRAPRKRDFEAEFQRQLQEFCKGDPAVIHHVSTVWRLQKKNDGRFRVWSARGDIILSTEFRHPVRDRALWKDAKRVAAELGADWDVLEESRELDKFRKGDGPWQYGPLHGVKVRQVDIQMKITDTSNSAVAALKRRVAKATQALWDKVGVNVL